MKRILLLSVLLALSLQASAQNRPQGGGGAIVLVAALPAACTPNVTRPVVYQGKVWQCTALNTWTAVSTGGTGDVVGPASSTDNAVARFDLATGKLLQDSVVLIGDTGNITGVGTLASGAQTITSAANPCFAVGPNGVTNPTLAVKCDVASAISGVLVTGRATGAGVDIDATGGTNESIRITPKGTGSVTVPNGTAANPSINFPGSLTTGIYQLTTNILGFTANGSAAAILGQGAFRLTSTVPFGFASGDAGATNIDTGAARFAAGGWRFTNGSTGTSQILLGTSTDTADAQFSVYSQSPTRPSLKLRAVSGTAGTINALENYDAAGTLVAALGSDGKLSLPLGTVSAPTLHPSTDAASGLYWTSATNLSISVSNVERFRFGSGGALSLTDGIYIGSTIGGADTILVRDSAANTLAQRNGVNAQTFRVYESYTDASNYRRLTVNTGSGNLGIIAEGLGTGVGPNLFLQSETSIRFRTGGSTVKWQMDTTGNFIANTDNTYDIGASGAARPRNVYIAGFAVIGSVVQAGASGSFDINGRSKWSSASDGVAMFSNAAATDFSRLQLGGTSASFPAIKRNGAGIDIRLADDSNYANLAANSFTVPSAGYFFLSSNAAIGTSASGKMTLFNGGLTDAPQVLFGGATSSFPSLKRSSAALETKLADDSAYATHRALNFSVNNACVIRSGAGDPESVVTGNVCDLYLRTDGGALTTLYIKESGTGNTGWVGK